MAIGSVIVILILLNFFNLNIKNIRNSYDALGIALAAVAALVLISSKTRCAVS
jgi:hypothetical protein